MYNISNFLIILICILICIAMFTVAERKVMAAVQRRTGPFIIGFFGLIQPFSDGLKLVFKEVIILKKIYLFFYFCIPIYIFSLSILNWSILPVYFSCFFYYGELMVFFLIIISSLI